MNTEEKLNAMSVNRAKVVEVKKAEQRLLMSLLDDMYNKRAKIYRMTFVRGLFFGLGSVIGGTVLIALTIWILSLLVDIPGGVGDFVQYIVNLINNKV
jgi:hypothetical protein